MPSGGFLRAWSLIEDTTSESDSDSEGEATAVSPLADDILDIREDASLDTARAKIDVGLDQSGDKTGVAW